MAALKRHKIERALAAKGFVRDDTHHAMFVYYRDGLKTGVKTRLSHGPGGSDVPPAILAQIRKQVHLQPAEFAEFVACPLSQEGYERLLVERGALASR